MRIVCWPCGHRSKEAVLVEFLPLTLLTPSSSPVTDRATDNSTACLCAPCSPVLGGTTFCDPHHSSRRCAVRSCRRQRSWACGAFTALQHAQQGRTASPARSSTCSLVPPLPRPHPLSPPHLPPPMTAPTLRPVIREPPSRARRTPSARQTRHRPPPRRPSPPSAAASSRACRASAPGPSSPARPLRPAGPARAATST